jgi:site-specific DNA-cytosine methylase
MGINVLSLFDGVSCGRLALERAGVKVDKYFASEIDKYAIQVTTKNYPDTIQLGDITKIHSVPEKIDLLIGGSPCQGFSFAGKQLNFDDPRSKLFFDYVRILNLVKPKYFLLENVNMKKEYQDIITNYLGVEPIKINSELVSAQMRNRLYWTNISDVAQPEDKGILLSDIIESGYVDRKKSFCLDANYFKGGNLKSYFEKHRRQIVFTNEKKTDFRMLTTLECERLQTLPDGYTEGVSNTQRYKMIGNGWTVDVIKHIFEGLSEYVRD